jgi:hypothetical protein
MAAEILWVLTSCNSMFIRINWFPGFGCLGVVFLFEFKEFPFRNQISMSTTLHIWWIIWLWLVWSLFIIFTLHSSITYFQMNNKYTTFHHLAYVARWSSTTFWVFLFFKNKLRWVTTLPHRQGGKKLYI